VTQYNEVADPSDDHGRLAFRHENDGETAVTESLLPMEPPLSPSAMPWKNKLQSSFADDPTNNDDYVPRLLELEKILIPKPKPKPIPKPKAKAKETRDPKKVLSDAFNMPTPHYFLPSEALKPKVKKLTLMEQAIKQAAAKTDSDHKLRIAQMLGKLVR
jgi:hypothetical protein